MTTLPYEPTVTTPAKPAPRPLSFPAMRRLAGLLLLAMLGLFIVSHLQTSAHPAWGYVRAFAEAALVGGLADWFAVTAIFRRPFGLPIPHTAIIPRSKERIATALGDFVADNFLEPSNVSTRLADADMAGSLGAMLSQRREAERIAGEIARAIPGVLDTFDNEAIADFARRQAAAFSEDGRVAPTLGGLLKMLTDQGRHQAVLDVALAEGWRALAEHKHDIRKGVREKTAWLWKLIGVDGRIADTLIKALQDTIHDVSVDPDHPGRRKLTEILTRLAEDLRSSPELQAKIELAARDVLAQPIVASYLGDVWSGVKDAVRRQALQEDSDLREVLTDAIMRAGEGIVEDVEARAALNERLRTLFTALAERYGRDISNLIAETIRSWDSDTVVEKLEQNVGRDLQYVRINGTLIGGLIGLAIHQISLMMG